MSDVTKITDVANQVQKFWGPIVYDKLRSHYHLAGLVSKDYSGEIKIVNTENENDYVILQVSLSTPVSQKSDSLFGWVILRGFVLNPNDDGSTISARAINLHYLEINPTGIHKGIVRLKKVNFNSGMFIKISEKGLMGNMVRISGFCRGGLEIL